MTDVTLTAPPIRAYHGHMIHTDNIATRPASAGVILGQIALSTRWACGIRNPVDLGDGIRFDVATGGKKIVVKLAANDTYAVELIRIWNFKAKSLDFAENVYCDQLSDVIYRMVNK